MCLISSLAVGLGVPLATSLATSIGTTLGVAGGWGTALGAGVLGLGELAIGSSLAGGAIGTYGALQQAQAQQEQANYQAEVAERNAQMASRRAENIELEGNQKRQALLRNAQQQQGTARAGYGAAGVVLGSGSAADYEADVWDAYDLDRRNLDYEIASNAWQQKVSAYSSKQQATLLSNQAKNYGTQGMTSLLTGAFSTIGDTIGTGSKVATAIGKLV